MEGVPHGRGRAHGPHRFEVGQQGLGRGRPHAIIYRDGLMAFAETVIGSRRMRRAVRDGTVLAWLGGLSGLLLAYYFTSVGAFAALSALNFLCFLLLWLLTVLLLAGLVRHY